MTLRPEGERYRRLSSYLQSRFQKPVRTVTLRGSFGCPNRDGRVGIGGCLFCSESALIPRMADAFGPIESQLVAGIARADERFPGCGILAYFQDGAVTAAPLERWAPLVRTALAHPRVVAAAVGTRPDFLGEDALDFLGELSRQTPVWVELGLQVANDRLLADMNRNHTVLDFAEAARKAGERGVAVVAHLILDLPGEGEPDRWRTASLLNRLPVAGVKLHNLHVLRETPIEALWRRGEIRLGTREEYAAAAARFIEYLDPATVIHRLTGEGPPELMLAPDWARRKDLVLREVAKELERRNGFQGCRRAGGSAFAPDPGLC